MKILQFLFFLFCSMPMLSSQNVHFKTYYAPMRTVYKAEIFKKNVNGGVVGFRLAVGADRFQIGVESEEGLSFPAFSVEENMQQIAYFVENTYRGLFLRANFSSIPIYRLGVIAKLGGGYFSDTLKRETNGQIDLSLEYPDRIFGFNAGIGVSGPIRRWLHWDFMYQFNYHQRPEIIFDNNPVEQHSAWQHAFQFGISANLVFGKTKERAQEMTRGRGY